jgi:hypothetical protein
MILALGIGGSIFSFPLFAHHGYVAYDTDKKITIKGTVTQWHWSNPHCLLQMDATDESGQVVHWIVETENPSSMTRMGWTDKSLKPGEQITLTALPVKNGRPVGRIIEVVTSSGERLPGRVGADTQVKPEDPAKQ